MSFCKLVVTIPDRNDGETLYQFSAGLKHQIRLEALKSGPTNIYDALRTAPHVDTSLFGASMFSGVSSIQGCIPWILEM